MTVIAGFWRLSERSGQRPSAESVSMMIDAQHVDGLGFAGITSEIRESGQIVFGRYDATFASRQVIAVSTARRDDATALVVADIRIDNRAELLARFGLRASDAIGDEDLILLAYRLWGDRLVDHVVGDFALAFWSAASQSLTLIRDPTGQRPLHYYLGNSFVAFASLPAGLFGLEEVKREPNGDRLAEFIALVPQRGPESFFQGVARVEPAQIVTITPSGVRSRYYWSMPVGRLRYRNPQDYVSAFRELLDRATEARLRGSGATVGAHLSAGLDSSAVTSTAARLMAAIGGRVLAVTTAPRQDFTGPVPYGRIADESAIAAELAERYGNIDHIVLRTSGVSPLNSLDDDSTLFGQPVGYPCNNLWWRQANEAARSADATIMLTGEMGNLTISAGGLGILADYVRSGRLATWLKEVIALERGGPRWRGLMAASFGPWLPRGLMKSLRSFAGGGRAAELDLLLTHDYREFALAQASRLNRMQSGDGDREIRWEMLKSSDPGNFRKGALLKWGVDECDPTADRRLIEFCFSLPPEQLLGGGQTRRLARSALADRVPRSTLTGPRGYQYADWYEAIDKPALEQAARRIAANSVASRVIDIDAVNKLIARWPIGDWASSSTIGAYRIGLLRTLSAGIFALKASH